MMCGWREDVWMDDVWMDDVWMRSESEADDYFKQ